MQAGSALAHAGNGMSTGQSQTDEGLMAMLSGGRDDALAELLKRYQNDVFRFCLHYLKNVDHAKEMSQETFLRVYSARDRFDVSRKFKPWLLCIARNLCLNELKRKKTVQMETLEDYASSAREESGEIHAFAVDGPSDRLMAEERRQTLLHVLEGLPADAREIVNLRYFQRMSAKEIAEVVDSTEGAVRTRIHRILRQLQESCEHLKDQV